MQRGVQWWFHTCVAHLESGRSGRSGRISRHKEDFGAITVATMSWNEQWKTTSTLVLGLMVEYVEEAPFPLLMLLCCCPASPVHITTPVSLPQQPMQLPVARSTCSKWLRVCLSGKLLAKNNRSNVFASSFLSFRVKFVCMLTVWPSGLSLTIYFIQSRSQVGFFLFAA